MEAARVQSDALTRLAGASCLTIRLRLVDTHGFFPRICLAMLPQLTWAGHSYGVGVLAEFWHFDLQAEQWNNVSSNSSLTPSARMSHVALYHEETIWLHGGYNEEELDDLWSFDLQTRMWNLWQSQALTPPPRYMHVAVVASGCIWIHGGSGRWRAKLQDLWRFRIENNDDNMWTNVSSHGPDPRESHVAVTNGSHVWVHGGPRGALMCCFSERLVYSLQSSEGHGPLGLLDDLWFFKAEGFDDCSWSQAAGTV